MAYVLEGFGREIPTTVVCDIYAANPKTGEKFAFELKGPLPNSDQTKVSKEKIFKLYAMSQPAITDAFFALPYNPHGLERTSYNWHMPERWFNMKQDASILIGTDFWDKIGGMGTYQEILDAVSEISGEYKERIYREFLGMEPPPNSTVKL